MGVHWKVWYLEGGGGGVHKKPIYWGELPKKEWVWIICRFKRVLCKKEVGGAFERDGEVDTPMHTILE